VENGLLKAEVTAEQCSKESQSKGKALQKLGTCESVLQKASHDLEQATKLMRSTERQLNAINYGNTEVANDGLEKVELNEIADSASDYYNIIQLDKTDIPNILLPFLRLFYATDVMKLNEDGEAMLFGSLAKIISEDSCAYKQMAAKLNQEAIRLENKLKTVFKSPVYFQEKIEFLMRNCANSAKDVQDALDDYLPEASLTRLYFSQLEAKYRQLNNDIKHIITVSQNLNQHIDISDVLEDLKKLDKVVGQSVGIIINHQKTLYNFIEKIEKVQAYLDSPLLVDEEDFDTGTYELCLSRMEEHGVKNAKAVLETHGRELLCAVENELANQENTNQENTNYKTVFMIIDSFVKQYNQDNENLKASVACNDAITTQPHEIAPPPTQHVIEASARFGLSP